MTHTQRITISDDESDEMPIGGRPADLAATYAGAIIN
jgi:hypothetical protein